MIAKIKLSYHLFAKGEIFMGTKENIINSSLELFSYRGYDAVSMRDIAKEVGIRESSIYKHFKGKHEILEGIVSQCIDKIKEKFTELDIPGGIYGTDVSAYREMSVKEVAELCCGIFFLLLYDEEIIRFKRMLTIEQYKNEELGNIYREIFIERPIRYVKKVFNMLISNGIINDTDCDILVVEFFSPFFTLQYRYLHDYEKQKDILIRHAEYFITSHIKTQIDPCNP